MTDHDTEPDDLEPDTADWDYEEANAVLNSNLTADEQDTEDDPTEVAVREDE